MAVRILIAAAIAAATLDAKGDSKGGRQGQDVAASVLQEPQICMAAGLFFVRNAGRTWQRPDIKTCISGVEIRG
jgi:hypothetical protein